MNIYILLKKYQTIINIRIWKKDAIAHTRCIVCSMGPFVGLPTRWGAGGRSARFSLGAWGPGVVCPRGIYAHAYCAADWASTPPPRPEAPDRESALSSKADAWMGDLRASLVYKQSLQLRRFSDSENGGLLRFRIWYYRINPIRSLKWNKLVSNRVKFKTLSGRRRNYFELNANDAWIR